MPPHQKKSFPKLLGRDRRKEKQSKLFSLCLGGNKKPEEEGERLPLFKKTEIPPDSSPSLFLSLLRMGSLLCLAEIRIRFRKLY